MAFAVAELCSVVLVQQDDLALAPFSRDRVIAVLFLGTIAGAVQFALLMWGAALAAAAHDSPVSHAESDRRDAARDRAPRRLAERRELMAGMALAIAAGFL